MMEPDEGWAILHPSSIRIRFRDGDTIYTLRARLDITAHAPLALRRVEVLEWKIEPQPPTPPGPSAPLDPVTPR